MSDGRYDGPMGIFEGMDDEDLLKPGTKVRCNGGYPGVVVRHYDGSMYEIRLGSGLVCVDRGSFSLDEPEPVIPRLVAYRVYLDGRELMKFYDVPGLTRTELLRRVVIAEVK